MTMRNLCASLVLASACALSSGCATKSVEPLRLDDSALCDPAVRECASVTPGFVFGRIVAEEKIVRLQEALKTCQADTR